MTKAVQATDLRRRAREVLERVRVQRETVVVYADGTPQAVLIPYDEYEAFQGWQDRRRQRQAWLAELRAIAHEVSGRAALSGDEAMDLIDAARISR